MNYNIYVSLLSSIFPENPYSATGLSDTSITSPIELEISIIKVNFGRNCQDKLNFAARGLKSAVQKSDFLGGAA